MGAVDGIQGFVMLGKCSGTELNSNPVFGAVDEYFEYDFWVHPVLITSLLY